MDQVRNGFETALRYKLSQKTGTYQDENAIFVKCFKHFDMDTDGLVNFSEWTKAIEKIGIGVNKEDDLNHIFSIYDVEGKGSIDYKEFADIVLKQKPLKILPKPLESEEEKEYSPEATILDKLREKLINRNMRGLIGLAKVFKGRDITKGALLDFEQFKKCMTEIRLGLSDQEIADVFAKFEYKKTKKMKPETFLHYFHV